MTNIIDVNYKKSFNSLNIPEQDYTVIFRKINNDLISVDTISIKNEFVKSTISINKKNNMPPAIVSLAKNNTLVKYNFIDNYKNQIIPKKIILTWKTKNITGTDFEYPINVIKTLNPEYEITIYDDDDCRNFIKDNFDENVLKAYDSLKPTAYKADLFRYCYLYINGGIYLDIKTVCVKSFNYLLQNNKELLLISDILDNWIYNGIMGVIPNHQLMKIAIDLSLERILNKEYGETSLDITGPHILSRAFNKWIGRNTNENIYTNMLTEKITWAKVDNAYHLFIRDNSNQTIFYRYFSTYYGNHNTGKRYNDDWHARTVFM